MKKQRNYILKQCLKSYVPLKITTTSMTCRISSKQLDSNQQDTLVKYLYKNMSTSYGAKQGGLLLHWFEKTVEVTGLGPIVRFMADRRTV